MAEFNTPYVDLQEIFHLLKLVYIYRVRLCCTNRSAVCMWPPLAAAVARCVTDCALRDMPRCRQGTSNKYCNGVIQLALLSNPHPPNHSWWASYCTTHIRCWYNEFTKINWCCLSDDSMWSEKLLVVVRYASNRIIPGSLMTTALSIGCA